MSGVIWTSWQPELVIKSIKANARGKLEKACKLVVKEIRDSMKEKKSGKPYYLKWIGKHIAAADGESPARRYGDLFNGVEYKIEDRDDELVGTIGVNIDEDVIGYAYFLEVGTVKMGAKPYLLNTIHKSEDEIRKILGVK